MAASPSLLEERDAASNADEGMRVDEERQLALVRAHLPFVWRILRRLGCSPEDADDAAQEVFLIAVKKCAQIPEENERRFLFGTAVRVASRHRRSRNTRAAKIVIDDEDVDQVIAPGESTDELIDHKRARMLLDRALAEMTHDLRIAFTLSELDELSDVEIASLLGIPIGTAASRLRRAREQFRQIVKRLQKSLAKRKP